MFSYCLMDNVDSLISLLECFDSRVVNSDDLLIALLIDKRVFNGEAISKIDFFECNGICFNYGLKVYNTFLRALFPGVVKPDNPQFYLRDVMDKVGVSGEDIYELAFKLAGDCFKSNFLGDSLFEAGICVFYAESSTIGSSSDLVAKYLNAGFSL